MLEILFMSEYMSLLSRDAYLYVYVDEFLTSFRVEF